MPNSESERLRLEALGSTVDGGAIRDPAQRAVDGDRQAGVLARAQRLEQVAESVASVAASV